MSFTQNPDDSCAPSIRRHQTQDTEYALDEIAAHNEGHTEGGRDGRDGQHQWANTEQHGNGRRTQAETGASVASQQMQPAGQGHVHHRSDNTAQGWDDRCGSSGQQVFDFDGRVSSGQYRSDPSRPSLSLASPRQVSSSLNRTTRGSFRTPSASTEFMMQEAPCVSPPNIQPRNFTEYCSPQSSFPAAAGSKSSTAPRAAFSPFPATRSQGSIAESDSPFNPSQSSPTRYSDPSPSVASQTSTLDNFEYPESRQPGFLASRAQSHSSSGVARPYPFHSSSRTSYQQPTKTGVSDTGAESLIASPSYSSPLYSPSGVAGSMSSLNDRLAFHPPSLTNGPVISQAMTPSAGLIPSTFHSSREESPMTVWNAESLGVKRTSHNRKRQPSKMKEEPMQHKGSSLSNQASGTHVSTEGTPIASTSRSHAGVEGSTSREASAVKSMKPKRFTFKDGQVCGNCSSNKTGNPLQICTGVIEEDGTMRRCGACGNRGLSDCDLTGSNYREYRASFIAWKKQRITRSTNVKSDMCPSCQADPKIRRCMVVYVAGTERRCGACNTKKRAGKQFECFSG